MARRRPRAPDMAPPDEPRPRLLRDPLPPLPEPSPYLSHLPLSEQLAIHDAPQFTGVSPEADWELMSEIERLCGHSDATEPGPLVDVARRNVGRL